MKRIATLACNIRLALVVSLIGNVSCATLSKPAPTSVGQNCRIAWDKTDNPKVTGYQLKVIDSKEPTQQSVQFIPADTTTMSCKDAGANHEGLWDVTIQSCYNKSTCGPATEVTRIHIKKQ